MTALSRLHCRFRHGRGIDDRVAAAAAAAINDSAGDTDVNAGAAKVVGLLSQETNFQVWLNFEKK